MYFTFRYTARNKLGCLRFALIEYSFALNSVVLSSVIGFYNSNVLNEGGRG